LIPLIDKVIETTFDEFGDKKFGSRKDVVDEAVKDFMKQRVPEILESQSVLEVINLE